MHTLGLQLPKVDLAKVSLDPSTLTQLTKRPWFGLNDLDKAAVITATSLKLFLKPTKVFTNGGLEISVGEIHVPETTVK